MGFLRQRRNGGSNENLVQFPSPSLTCRMCLCMHSGNRIKHTTQIMTGLPSGQEKRGSSGIINKFAEGNFIQVLTLRSASKTHTHTRIFLYLPSFSSSAGAVPEGKPFCTIMRATSERKASPPHMVPYSRHIRLA